MPRSGPKRSLEGQQSILDATRVLIAKYGPSQVSVNQIAAEAGVGKATIYRWWSSKSAIMVEALEQWCAAENPPPGSGVTSDDIRAQMQGVAAVFRSPIGATIRELMAESQGDETVAVDFRKRFFDVRQSQAMATIQEGVDNGSLRADLDVGATVDMLYGPLWLRLLVGHRPLSRAFTDRVFEQAWPALAAP